MKERPIWLCLVLTIAAYCYILSREVQAYEKALLQSDAGFLEFTNMSVHGYKLYAYINPHSVGTFKIKGQSYACARLHSPLPDRPADLPAPSKD